MKGVMIPAGRQKPELGRKAGRQTENRAVALKWCFSLSIYKFALFRKVWLAAMR